MFSVTKFLTSVPLPLHHNLILCRTATKKAGGSSRNGRDSIGRRLGVKLFGGEVVKPGYIIIRQRGMKYKSGTNTKIGRDHTIYAISEGWVKFIYDKHKKTQTVTVSPMNPHIRPKLDQEKSADCKLIP